MLYRTLKPGLFESTSREAGEETEITDPGLAKRLIEEGALEELGPPRDPGPTDKDSLTAAPTPALSELGLTTRQLEVLQKAGHTTVESITAEALDAIPEFKPATRASIFAAVCAALAGE